MSDGLKNVAGSSISVKLGKKKYRLAPLTLKLMAELEEHVTSLKPDPLELVSKKLSMFNEKQQEVLLQKAMEKSVEIGSRASQLEVEDFMESFDGLCFFFWLAIKDNHEEITSHEEATEVLKKSDITPDDIKLLTRKLRQASGLETLASTIKNSERQTQQDPLESRGLESISN